MYEVFWVKVREVKTKRVEKQVETVQVGGREYCMVRVCSTRHG